MISSNDIKGKETSVTLEAFVFFPLTQTFAGSAASDEFTVSLFLFLKTEICFSALLTERMCAIQVQHYYLFVYYCFLAKMLGLCCSVMFVVY